jgi:hypothetical protein
MEITVEETQGFHRGIGTKYLVRGLGKRAIIVVVRPFYGGGRSRIDGVWADAIARRAAQRACRRGWKVIVAEPSMVYDDVVDSCNWAQFGDTRQDKRRFLVDVHELERQAASEQPPQDDQDWLLDNYDPYY